MKEINEDKFYEEACRILSESKEGRFASNSPILILPKERESFWRSKYHEMLLSKLRNNEMVIKYLFQKETTKKLLLDNNNIEQIIQTWKGLLKNSNLDLRFTDKKYDSCILGDKEILLKKDSKRFLLETDSEKGRNLTEKFDELFSTASEDHESLISEIQKEVL